VEVTAVNSSPVANNDNSYTTRRNRTLTVAARGVLLNDVDVDTVPSRVTAVFLTQQQTGGTVVLNSNGGFTYTPSPGFTGTFTFTYKATNGTFTDSLGTIPMSPDSAAATVTITVN
jgi:hypothetical protein